MFLFEVIGDYIVECISELALSNAPIFIGLLPINFIGFGIFIVIFGLLGCYLFLFKEYILILSLKL